ncbi:MAG: quinol monooxygenase YgiN [Clostridium sp.]|jgi:quinol monooxygenase YgiN
MKNIVIIASIKAKSEFKDEVYNELIKLHEATHANDKGCIQYDMHKNLEDENSFTFIETWENAELLDAHMKKEHFLSFVKSVDKKLENLEITKLEKNKEIK